MQNEAAVKRERAHTKLLTFGERQVVAYLNRDESGLLNVIVQLWVAASDEQLRVSIRSSNDQYTQAMFDILDDETLAFDLENIGVPALIAEMESQ